MNAKQATGWLEALEKQGLEVTTARNALAVKGWLDSGNYALNWAMSGKLLGGYPLGHTVEIFGDPSTGKSYLVARALAMVQEAGGVAMLDDTEGAYNLRHMEELGVDVDKLPTPKRSRTVRDHLNVATAFVNAFRSLKLAIPGVLACDSIAELSTERELESRLAAHDMSKAKELKAFFRIIGSDLADLPIAYICTNHLTANIGGFSHERNTPGGGGPKFHSSIRIDLRAVTRMKTKDGTYTGVICRVVIDKNRIVAPWKETRLAIPFTRPISRASGLVALLLQQGLLGVEGKTLTYQNKRLDGIRENKSDFLKQDESGEQLLVKVPEILQEADEWFATYKPSRTTEIPESGDDDGEEADDA